MMSKLAENQMFVKSLSCYSVNANIASNYTNSIYGLITVESLEFVVAQFS